ncbi:MAG: outer membrane protein assembly factor BamE [Rhodoferax sp.]|jgi:hypothetical protein|nr:outer membrane protein assembly factor BamE [Rhodoferax sp.]
MRFVFHSVVLSSLLAFTACSSYAPPSDLAGMTQDQILARMGTPETQRPLEGGAIRLEYPTGPYGHHTWFVDVDATGKVLRAQQVLTEQNFNQIVPGMAQAQVRQRLGRPNSVSTLARSRGVVWNYRFEGPFCEWFQVEISAEQTVRAAGYGKPPECERGEKIIFP